MTPADEAAQILIRMMNTMVYPLGKRLSPAHEAEIRRACELLSADGTLAPLDDLPSAPRVSPAEAAANFAEVPEVVRRWKEQRGAER